MLATLLLVLALAQRPGILPDTPWSCPATHPIKGYVSVESGRRTYYLPGSRFYDEASPERCYASEADALRDGSRPSRTPAPTIPRDDRVRLRRSLALHAALPSIERDQRVGGAPAPRSTIAWAISWRSPSG